MLRIRDETSVLSRRLHLQRPDQGGSLQNGFACSLSWQATERDRTKTMNLLRFDDRRLRPKRRILLYCVSAACTTETTQSPDDNSNSPEIVLSRQGAEATTDAEIGMNTASPGSISAHGGVA